jgi:CheY-like chemotaxis protein
MLLLCVDDEPVGLEVRKVLLERQGYRVLTAHSGHDALRLFAAAKCPIKAAVLDYAMPNMNGGELAAELRRLNPSIKIMMLSAHLDLPDEVLSLVDVRVVKGISPMALVSGVKQLLP